MWFFFRLFFFLSLSFLATAKLGTRRAVHERHSHIPLGWNLARRHDPSTTIHLRIALAQSNIEHLEEYLYDVSHPNSPNYGKHWSAGKISATFAPSHESVDAVRTWLYGNNVEPHRVRFSKGWMQLKATVREVEDLLQTQYNVYQHESGAEHIACEKYHLPEHLQRHVDFITPTVHFDTKVWKRSGGRSLKNIGVPGGGTTNLKMSAEVKPINSTNIKGLKTCDAYMIPECLRELYSFKYAPKVPDQNTYGVVEFAPETYLQDDLNLFAQHFGPDLYGISPNMVPIDGGELNKTQSLENNGEPGLDLQYAMNLVTKNQNITLYQVGDLVEGASENNFLDALDSSYCIKNGNNQTVDSTYPDTQPGGYDGPEACGTVTPSSIISVSYSYDEADLTAAYVTRQCAEYGKLGLMGVTFLFASGDNGVAGQDGVCLNPNGSQTTDGYIFNPTFPSTCPFVTSVGATQVSPGKTVYDPKSACETAIYSGGGFSNYFAIPEYQKDTVMSYLNDTPIAYNSSIWNSTGSRAYPDLSANGANYVVAVDGELLHGSGTSASTPVVGAMLAMVNDARIAQNKSRIGFINPVIYDRCFSDAFHDITNGTNPGCGALGFNTSKGWDPVTGLGTINFPVLLSKWLELP